MTKGLVNKILALCKSKKIIVVADNQVSSQIGDISKYRDINLLSSTENEIRFSYKDKDSSINNLADEVLKNHQLDFLFVKLGTDNLIIKSKEKGLSDHSTDKIPSLNYEPVDVSGAGDSMLVSSALALTVGSSIWESALIGSIASEIHQLRQKYKCPE
eukprot:GHVR01187706.1.p2 GENE.GHVR01187706.1~~GHVR01187706.1.p2  ORF type:complete len:158 (-),score=17.34 GHVR01187706.1:2049-2522(-)